MALLSLVLLLVLPLPQAPAQSTDPIAERLARAKAECEAADGRDRADLLRALDAVHDAEVEAPAKLRVIKEREAFEKRGVLPATIAAESRKFEQARLRTARKLLAAYEQAIDSYGEASQHDSAGRLAADRARLQAEIDLFRWRDLRCQIDLAKHDPKKAWLWEGSSLLTNGSGRGILRLPVPADAQNDSYELRLDVERTSGQGDLQLLFSRADTPAPERGLLVLGGWNGKTSGLERIAGKDASDNATTSTHPVFPATKVSTIVLTCTPASIVVTVNNQRVLRWNTGPGFALPEGVAKEFADTPAMHLIASASASFRVDGIAFRSMESQQQRPKPAAAAPAAARKPDFLEVGTTWRGKNAAGAACSVVVTARNRAAKTAAVKFTNEAKMTFRFVLATNDDGSSFTITNIVRLNARKVITKERGSGGATAKTFHMAWTYTSDAGNLHRQIESRFNGRR